jgi:hypothetical protein
VGPYDDIENSAVFKELMLEIICCGNVKEYEHLKTFIADIIQDPGCAKRSAHVFISSQGCGKGNFGQFLENLIGEANVMMIDDPDRYFEKFNKAYSMKLLKIFEELKEKGAVYKSFNKLKNDITKDYDHIEGKGEEFIKVRHCARYMFFTNNAIRSIHIEPNDTRFTVHVMDPKRSGDEHKPWWDRVRKTEIYNPEFLKKAFMYFKNMKYDKVAANAPFENEAKETIKSYSMDNVYVGLLDFINLKFADYDMDELRKLKEEDMMSDEFRVKATELLDFLRKEYGTFTSQNIRNKIIELIGSKLMAKYGKKLVGQMRVGGNPTSAYCLNPAFIEKCFHRIGYKNTKVTLVPRDDECDDINDGEVNRLLKKRTAEPKPEAQTPTPSESDTEPPEVLEAPAPTPVDYSGFDNTTGPTPEEPVTIAPAPSEAELRVMKMLNEPEIPEISESVGSAGSAGSSSSSCIMIMNGQEIEVIDDFDEPIVQESEPEPQRTRPVIQSIDHADIKDQGIVSFNKRKLKDIAAIYPNAKIIQNACDWAAKKDNIPIFSDEFLYQIDDLAVH